jgi:dihydrolipoamide dehydrogenase
MTRDGFDVDLVVLGAGPGGYAAAFHAADMDLRVALIDSREEPGGVCLNVGCIPSKALLHTAEVMTDARDAGEFGVKFAAPKIDLDKLRDWKQGIVKQLTSGLAQLAKRRGVEYVRGEAKFDGPGRLSVSADGVQSVTFKQAIIATGSSPSSIPGVELGTERIMDSTGALELAEIPEKLLVIGGGYIGLELGTVYAALGSRVTVVEMLDGLLPGVDRDLVKPLARRIEKAMAAVHLETRVSSVSETPEGVEVQFEGAFVGEETFDRVLVAVGRHPNSQKLGLESTAVDVDESGFIKIDEQCRTSESNIFAIGDVAGQPMLAHKAMAEGKVAAEVIAGKNTVFERRAIPAVVFTDPEVAWTGLTEKEASDLGVEVKVTRFPWAASGRALTLGRADGLTKMLLEPGTGRVLGMGIVGPGAGELIAEATLAVEMAAVAEDLALTIHAHPTLAETVGEVAEIFLGQATHILRK